MSRKQVSSYSKKETSKAVTFMKDYIISRIEYIISLDNPSEEELNSLKIYNEYLDNYSKLEKNKAK